MKDEEEKLLQEVHDRKKGSRRPESQKIAAVFDLESGNYTRLQVMEKYKILADGSLLDWCEVYAADKSKYLRKKQHKEATRRKAVHEIESGLLSIEQVMKKYDMSKSRILHWIKEYSDKIEAGKKENLSLHSQSNYDLMGSKKQSAKEKELEAALKAAQLKILGLETMIEVAETELNISIRKKSGTKQ